MIQLLMNMLHFHLNRVRRRHHTWMWSHMWWHTMRTKAWTHRSHRPIRHSDHLRSDRMTIRSHWRSYRLTVRSHRWPHRLTIRSHRWSHRLTVWPHWWSHGLAVWSHWWPHGLTVRSHRHCTPRSIHTRMHTGSIWIIWWITMWSHRRSHHGLTIRSHRWSHRLTIWSHRRSHHGLAIWSNRWPHHWLAVRSYRRSYRLTIWSHGIRAPNWGTLWAR